MNVLQVARMKQGKGDTKETCIIEDLKDAAQQMTGENVNRHSSQAKAKGKAGSEENTFSVHKNRNRGQARLKQRQ